MPTYEYQCDACGDKFEKFQSITSQPVRKCPACGKSKARRLISTGAGLIFKGSGFYITDYRSSSYKAAASADGGSEPAESKADSKGDSKGDSKTQPTPETKSATPAASTSTASTPASGKSTSTSSKK